MYFTMIAETWHGFKRSAQIFRLKAAMNGALSWEGLTKLRKRRWANRLFAMIAALAANCSLPADAGTLAAQVTEARRLRAQGAAAASIKIYESVLAHSKASLVPSLLSLVLLEESQTALSLGDYQRSADRAAESALIFDQAHDLANLSSALNTVGLARLYRGEYDSALKSFERSLQIERERSNGDAEAARLNNIGNVYFFQGKYLDALREYERAMNRVAAGQEQPWAPRRRQLTLANTAILYEQLGQDQRALSLYRQIGAESPALPPGEQAQLISNMGTLYRRLGDPVKAMKAYAHARELFAKDKHADGEIGVLQNIGIALALDLADLKGAFNAFTKAGEFARKTSNQREVIQSALFRGEALYRMKRLPEAAMEFHAALEGATRMGTGEERWRALYGTGRVLIAQGKLAEGAADLKTAIAEVERVRSDLGQLKAEFLASKRDLYDAAIGVLLDKKPISIDDLLALIEQARSRTFREMFRGGSAHMDLHSVQSRLRPGTLLLDFWVGQSRMAVISITHESASVNQGPIAPGGQWLSGILALTQPGVRHVIVIPDGILQTVALEALPAGNTLLIERAAVSYLPALFLLGTAPPPSHTPSPPWQPQLLAFANPVMDGHLLPGDQQWTPLPKSLDEVRSIAAELPGRAELHAGGDDLKRYIKARPLLHFSTHAVADARNASNSRIVFSPDRATPESRYLFWREAQALNLHGVDLVTLSACDTESGTMIRGEGIQSFSRAFLAAGAGATITTLWKVADGPTAEFMKQFYYALSRGESKAEALRTAKLRFLHSGSELAQSRYWAAFVLNGEGENPIPWVLSWEKLWLGIGAILISIALTAAAARRLRRL
ncbi:MAG: Tetratricopeptide 2 repeat protein [Bryobacterales bacterium]|nr:Tetratricopeptide 2 repeat protein [Bryobacterales bacterium]